MQLCMGHTLKHIKYWMNISPIRRTLCMGRFTVWYGRSLWRLLFIPVIMDMEVGYHVFSLLQCFFCLEDIKLSANGLHVRYDADVACSGCSASRR